MDSPASSTSDGHDDQEADDGLSGFDDFTIASSWEKVIAAVEATLRDWQAAGSAGLLVAGAVPVVGSRCLHRVHKEISFGHKPYVIIFFFHVGSEKEVRDEWPMGLHHLQLWFGVKDFVVVAPVSNSGVILDAPEATTLLSTVAIALSSCGSGWPAFVPVHDPTRKAYKGIQGTEGSYSISFEADRIGSWVPVRFMHLEGLYELFASKVAFTAPSSAEVPALRVEFTMRLTYRTPMPGFDYHNQGGGSQTAEAKADYDGESPNDPLWDEDLPWAEWFNVDDPIKGFELVAIWNNRFVDSPIQMAEYENASTFDADKWSIVPIFVEKKGADQRGEGFAETLEALVNAFYVAGEAQFMDDFANVLKPDMDLLLETFTVPPPSVLDRVVKDLFYEALIPRGEGFSFKTNGISIKGAPRESLFGRFSLQALRFGSCNIRAISELWLEFLREVRWCWDECQPLPRVSPDEPPDLATCLIHQKLQLLAACIQLKAEESLGKESVPGHQTGGGKDSPNAEATSSVEHVNNQDFEEPKILVSEDTQIGTGDSTSQDSIQAELLHESLPTFTSESSEYEMDSFFDPTAHESSEMDSFFDPPAKDSSESSHKDVRTSVRNTPAVEVLSSSDDEKPWEPLENVDVHKKEAEIHKETVRQGRRGSAGPVKKMMLLKIEQPLHAPVVQRSPIMTEDMLLEREQAIAALSRSPSEKVARIRLQTDILASDMSAFKAANPGAVLEDFVRWHSPRDWLVNEPFGDGEISGSRNVEDSESTWPPQGRLSNRMLQPDNIWSQIWEHSASEPASEQKPLFDFKREGEKVMHYLDTLRPQQLLAQMLCMAFMASADVLRRTRAGHLSRLHSELEELFVSMDIILQPLSKLDPTEVPSKEEADSWRTDLLQLCAVFRRVETDVHFAASLFQKLKLVPTVMTTLFNSYLDDGERLTSARVQSTSSQSSWKGGSSGSDNEREGVSDLFPFSNTSQSVGRRMGNFLNGNEPDVREVKFHCYEEDLHRRWSSQKERQARAKMFSHRMYVCGTSTDLQVALSVVSRD